MGRAERWPREWPRGGREVAERQPRDSREMAERWPRDSREAAEGQSRDSRLRMILEARVALLHAAPDTREASSATSSRGGAIALSYVAGLESGVQSRRREETQSRRRRVGDAEEMQRRRRRGDAEAETQRRGRGGDAESDGPAVRVARVRGAETVCRAVCRWGRCGPPAAPWRRLVSTPSPSSAAFLRAVGFRISTGGLRIYRCRGPKAAAQEQLCPREEEPGGCRERRHGGEEEQQGPPSRLRSWAGGMRRWALRTGSRRRRTAQQRGEVGDHRKSGQLRRRRG